MANDELPTFREIAALRIADAGARDKTINVKVAINTARMMVESENIRDKELLEALRNVLAYSTGKSNGNEQIRLDDCAEAARTAISKATQRK